MKKYLIFGVGAVVLIVLAIISVLKWPRQAALSSQEEVSTLLTRRPWCYTIQGDYGGYYDGMFTFNSDGTLIKSFFNDNGEVTWAGNWQITQENNLWIVTYEAREGKRHQEMVFFTNGSILLKRSPSHTKDVYLTPFGCNTISNYFMKYFYNRGAANTGIQYPANSPIGMELLGCQQDTECILVKETGVCKAVSAINQQYYNIWFAQDDQKTRGERRGDVSCEPGSDRALGDLVARCINNQCTAENP